MLVHELLASEHPSRFRHRSGFFDDVTDEMSNTRISPCLTVLTASGKNSVDNKQRVAIERLNIEKLPVFFARLSPCTSNSLLKALQKENI